MNYNTDKTIKQTLTISQDELIKMLRKETGEDIPLYAYLGLFYQPSLQANQKLYIRWDKKE